MTLLFSLFFFKCNGDGTRPENHYIRGQKVLLVVDKAKPSWTRREGGIGQIDGEKYVFFKGEADSKYRKVALESAKADAMQKSAQSIRLIIATQFAEAWQSLGVGKREDMERVREGLVVTKSFVRLRGLRLLSSYTEDLGVVESVKDKRPIFSHKETRAYVLYGMPYHIYIQIRDKQIRKTRKEVKPNTRQKYLIKKIQRALKIIDKKEGYQLDLPERVK